MQAGAHFLHHVRVHCGKRRHVRASVSEPPSPPLRSQQRTNVREWLVQRRQALEDALLCASAVSANEEKEAVAPLLTSWLAYHDVSNPSGELIWLEDSLAHGREHRLRKGARDEQAEFTQG